MRLGGWPFLRGERTGSKRMTRAFLVSLTKGTTRGYAALGGGIILVLIVRLVA